MNGFTILGTSTAIADLAAGHFRKKPGESLRAALNHRSAMALWLDYQSIGSELYKDGAKPTPLSESNQVVALSVNLRPKAIELRWLAPQPPERIIRILTKKATR